MGLWRKIRWLLRPRKPAIEVAFHWVVDRLEAHKIPYIVNGGLAARVYGAKRPVRNIDIDLPFDRARDLFEDLRAHLAHKPQVVRDAFWDLPYYRMTYKGQRIDLGDSNQVDADTPAITAAKEQAARHATNEIVTIFGRFVPVVSKEELCHYKKKRGRPEDLQDLADMGAV